MNSLEKKAFQGKHVARNWETGTTSSHRNLPGGVTASTDGLEPMNCSKHDPYVGTSHERMSDSSMQKGMVDSSLLFNGDLNIRVRTMVSEKQQGHKRMRDCESARKEGNLGGMNWVDYDVDIVDNIKKTKRFTSELMANDLATRMSMSTSAEVEGCGGADGLCELKASPSPLSRLKKFECDCAEVKAYQDQDANRYGSQTGEEVVHACAAGVEFTPKQHGPRRLHEDDSILGSISVFNTPIKGWQEGSNCSRCSRAGIRNFPGVESISPMAKREDFQGASSYSGHVHPTSPSDMKHDGNADLRRTALVRLALRNSGEALHSSLG